MHIRDERQKKKLVLVFSQMRDLIFYFGLEILKKPQSSLEITVDKNYTSKMTAADDQIIHVSATLNFQSKFHGLQAPNLIGVFLNLNYQVINLFFKPSIDQ